MIRACIRADGKGLVDRKRLEQNQEVETMSTFEENPRHWNAEHMVEGRPWQEEGKQLVNEVPTNSFRFSSEGADNGVS